MCYVSRGGTETPPIYHSPVTTPILSSPRGADPDILLLKHAHAFGKWEQPVSEVNQSNRKSRIFLLQKHAYAFGKWEQTVSEVNQKNPKRMRRIEYFCFRNMRIPSVNGSKP